jgi:hypothetical protein
MAAYGYLINRMTALLLSLEKRKTEWMRIHDIANNNKFPKHIITRLEKQIQTKTQMTSTKFDNTKGDDNKKWAIFTYHSPKIRKITNLFRQTNVRISFKSSNTIQQRTRPRTMDTTQDKDKSGIYNLICRTCKKSYIGQTSRTLTIRHREHIRYIKNNDPQSAYALHILQNAHECGPISDTMSLHKPVKKPHMLIPYEQLYIQSFHHNEKLIPEQNCGEQDPLFALANDYTPARNTIPHP